MTLSCAIIDDEPLAVSLLESYVKKTPYLDLAGRYNSALNAVSDLTDHPVDLLFLDIQMPELNGLEFSKVLPAETRIIFTTAFEQYAVDSYRVNALDYLLKPWFQLLRRDQQSREDDVAPAGGGKTDMESIFVKSEYRLLQIELRKILYIEGLKDYIKIYLDDEPKPILSLMSMKLMEDTLPPSRFVRVHRSFIVNIDNIKVIERNRIVYGKEYIPISDNYKQRFLDLLARRSIIKL